MVKKLSLLVLTFVFVNFLSSQTTGFKKLHPCSFQISLPESYKFSNMNEEKSSDFCDYEVKFKTQGVKIEAHSLLKERFETDDVAELFNKAKEGADFDISYQFKSDRFFVISGKKGNKIVYTKRYIGDMYISDLLIEYEQSKKTTIEKYIGKISSSFVCD